MRYRQAAGLGRRAMSSQWFKEDEWDAVVRAQRRITQARVVPRNVDAA